ncbi:endonuclease VII domain-containing protein [Streptomyces sp. NBC_01077]|uniref:endonuclease domain-containing protein n=1 Tax=Streptomyces sp. NBC_01077 TaxID=2903746 RepID=UPI00386BF650|nr:endonuclease VII domain-containing protein [Streptomyces sp. NBC_01077]WSV43460.1 endonuclease VII domain-containing protein [Streptomyces sp. NBC_01077]
MSEHVIPGRRGGLISLSTADSLWVDLTSGSAVPTAVAAFTCSPADARAGYVLLGGRVVTTVTADGSRWSVPQTEVRRAAAELNAVQMERQDLVRIGPFGGMPGQEHDEGMLLPWRRRISRELQEPGETGRAARDEGSRPSHLAGIDWRRVLVEQPHGRAAGTWWLPRAVVRVLDAAEHAERRWLHATRQASQTPVELSSTHRQAKAAAGRETTSTDDSATVLQVYNGELKGQLYSAVSRKPGVCGKVAGWACAVCRTAPAAVLDHCHEHGYVRAPVCHSCNTQERPDHLYSNDIRVAGHYTRLFDTHAADWLPHWHRCPGCRARTTLPLPHLAAWTAHTACRAMRPAHRAPRGRKPCGLLRVSWTGSQNAPGSCLLTVAVDLCPTGEHRVLTQVPYREAVLQFRTWLAVAAPAVAAAAGPDRLDGLPDRVRPVIADTSGEDLALF